MPSTNKKMGGCILRCKTIVYHQGHAAQQLHARGDIPFIDTNFGEAQRCSRVVMERMNSPMLSMSPFTLQN